MQELMKQRIADANGIDIDHARITSPLARFISNESVCGVFSFYGSRAAAYLADHEYLQAVVQLESKLQTFDRAFR